MWFPHRGGFWIDGGSCVKTHSFNEHPFIFLKDVLDCSSNHSRREHHGASFQHRGHRDGGQAA